MRPIRSEHDQGVVHDPWTGRPSMMSGSSAVHILTDQGAVESLRTTRQVACACGCIGPVGGFCYCSAAVCSRCFSHCLCGKPICPRHAVLIPGPSGRVVRLCRSCHEAAKRKRAIRSLARALLSPFVEFPPDG